MGQSQCPRAVGCILTEAMQVEIGGSGARIVRVGVNTLLPITDCELATGCVLHLQERIQPPPGIMTSIVSEVVMNLSVPIEYEDEYEVALARNGTVLALSLKNCKSCIATIPMPVTQAQLNAILRIHDYGWKDGYEKGQNSVRQEIKSALGLG
jgi:hypothetical protein